MTPISARARACVSNAASSAGNVDDVDNDHGGAGTDAGTDPGVLLLLLLPATMLLLLLLLLLPEEGEEATTVSRKGTARSVRSAAESRRCAHSSIRAHARSCNGSRDTDDGNGGAAAATSDGDKDKEVAEDDNGWDDEDESERKWAHKNVSGKINASDVRSAASLSETTGRGMLSCEDQYMQISPKNSFIN